MKAFSHAVSMGYGPAAKLVIKRRKSVSRNPDPYTVKERDTLLAWLKANTDAHVYGYFLTAFYTGMRTGELLAIAWPDVEGETLEVNKARVQGQITTTKTDEARTVRIPAIARVIAALPSRFKGAELFVNQYGRAYQSGYHLNRRFRDAHEATEVRHREGPYPWRHTYASIGLTSGAAHGWLAKQLGHSLPVFYGVYADWINTEDAHLSQFQLLTQLLQQSPSSLSSLSSGGGERLAVPLLDERQIGTDCTSERPRQQAKTCAQMFQGGEHGESIG